MFKFKLGSTVRSEVTDFEGIITSNSVHLNGCNRCYVQPKIDKEGKVPDGWWIDEPELVLIHEPEEEKPKPQKPGGFPSSVK